MTMPSKLFITSKPSTGGGASGVTIPVPGYFFPCDLIEQVWDPSNIDPRAGGSLNLVHSWKMFFLPYNITITRWRIQCDNLGGATAVSVFAGLADVKGNLIFDIGQQAVAGIGQVIGSALYDPTRTLVPSITLTPGYYLYAWGATATGGSGLVFPSMADFSALWNEQINGDTLNLSPVTFRWGHSGNFDITGGHLPLSIGTNFGGAATAPMNIAFFA